MSAKLSFRPFVVFVFVFACLINSGCNPFTAFYFLFLLPPPKIEAAHDGLASEKVVVLAHVSRGAQFVYPGLENDLVKNVSRELRDNVSGIKVVDGNAVRQWKDEHSDYELIDVGREFHATRVLYLEVESFTLHEHQSSTLFRGTAKIRVQVADVEKDGDIAFDAHVEPMFPGSRPIPTAEMSQDKFRALFLKFLARQVAHQFFEYPPDEDFTVN